MVSCFLNTQGNWFSFQKWRQNTWGGFFVRMVQAVGNHFSPFFEAMQEAMSSQENGPVQIAVLATLRILFIGVVVAAVYALSRVASQFLGQDIVIEQEIRVNKKDYDEAHKKEAEMKRRSSRDKRKEQ